MANITIDFEKSVGKIKPMHAVNNGSIKASSVEQSRGNFDAFRAAKIPYVRNHDASFCSDYGGEHTVDVHAVFPDFNANPYDERSYDFQLTDEYLQTIAESGAEVYYRLGSKIEHWSKQYGTVVPADFEKWAVVCEHIIRHYNEGWANGYRLHITYWEIWNEPDGIQSGSGAQPNWTGTPEEFYELYITAAAHLKKRFPQLKIGGPALSWLEHREWFENFLQAVKHSDKDVPLDFFSWHEYGTDPAVFEQRARLVREILDEYGFVHTESILNEYNYLEDWTGRFIASIEAIISERGAAFTASCMMKLQKCPLDMLMYYDARPSAFNGMFDFYTYRPLKGYYPFAMFSALYELGEEVFSESDEKDIYVCAATDGKEKAVMVSHYRAEGAAEPKEIDIFIGETAKAQGYLVDHENTMTPVAFHVEGGRLRATLSLIHI